MKGKTVLVIGMGTIGYPLARKLFDYRVLLGIEKVIFTKLSIDHLPRVKRLRKKGILFCVPEVMKADFLAAGFPVDLTFEEALADSQLVFECTTKGQGLAKKESLFKKHLDNGRVFVAQGSEDGFGRPVAYGMTVRCIKVGEQFIQVVSCNTHFVSCLVHTIGTDCGVIDPDNILSVIAVLCRRDVDFSQGKGAVASPEVAVHNDPRRGTHQGKDAANMFQVNLGWDLNIITSAAKLNQQVMHMTHFTIRLKERLTRENVLDRLRRNPLVALTEINSTNRLFSEIRDSGDVARCFNQAIVYTPSIHVVPDGEGSLILGWGFTPQDANSLLTSIAVAAWVIHGADGYQAVMQQLLEESDLLYDEI